MNKRKPVSPRCTVTISREEFQALLEAKIHLEHLERMNVLQKKIDTLEHERNELIHQLYELKYSAAGKEQEA